MLIQKWTTPTLRHSSHPALKHPSSGPLALLGYFHHFSVYKEGMHYKSFLFWYLDGIINFPWIFLTVESGCSLNDILKYLLKYLN